MLFSDLALSRRLERAEGHACVQFAKARQRGFPDSASTWTECAGVYAVFDGIDSPTTQSFGLGIFENLTVRTIETIEQFFFERGAPAVHEVSPFAGVAVLELLITRGYRPTETSTVLYRALDEPQTELQEGITVRLTGVDEAELWTEINARGWSHEHPELMDLLRGVGGLSSLRDDTFCFLAEFGGIPGAAGALCVHDGVALFAGAATIPEMRRRGLQSALLEARMCYAADNGCDLAMMVAEVGSASQRNAERSGFRIAYTRTKWRLSPHA
jgi:GNAT superfamily N-acetyltransferase